MPVTRARTLHLSAVPKAKCVLSASVPVKISISGSSDKTTSVFKAPTVTTYGPDKEPQQVHSTRPLSKEFLTDREGVNLSPLLSRFNSWT